MVQQQAQRLLQFYGPSMSPSPSVIISPYPSWTSSPSSTVSPTWVSPPPYTNSYPQGENDNSLSAGAIVSIFFAACLIGTVASVCFIASLKGTNPDTDVYDTPVTAPTNSTSNATATNEQQQQVNLVKSMSPEERRVYVTNFLKTQKYVDTSNGTTTDSSSFRVTQTRSFRIMCDSDDIYPESSDPPTSGSQQPSCAICLDQFKSGEDTCSAQNINCPHEYHLQCIFPWLLQSQDCPCCRRDFLSIDTEAVEPHHTRTAITLETNTETNTTDFLYSI